MFEYRFKYLMQCFKPKPSTRTTIYTLVLVLSAFCLQFLSPGTPRRKRCCTPSSVAPPGARPAAWRYLGRGSGKTPTYSIYIYIYVYVYV